MSTLFAALLLLAQDPEIQKVIQRLGSSDFEEQGRAAKILEGLGSEALPDLETATRSSNAQIRDWAVKIKGRIEQRLGRKATPPRPVDEPPLRKFEPAAGWTSRYPARAAKDKLGNLGAEPQILEALRWLARHQSPGGSWAAESFGNQCGDAKCSGPGERDFDTGVTGLSLLAFLGAGHGLQSTEFGEVVRRGLAWLMAHHDREGCLGERGMKYMYNHVVASLALTEAYLLTGSPDLKAAAEKAVQFTLMAQNPGKGWRYSAKCGDNDTSVTGWALLGLKAAELAGFDVPKKSLDGVSDWLNEATEPKYHQTGYNLRGTGKVYVPGKNEQFDHHATMTAIGVFARAIIQKKRGDPELAGIDLIAADLPDWRTNAVDFYYWHWGALAMHQLEGTPGVTWKKWFGAVRTALVENQRSDDRNKCRIGSWDPEFERWGAEGGRVYATALGALVLETPYRFPVVLPPGPILAPRKK